MFRSQYHIMASSHPSMRQPSERGHCRTIVDRNDRGMQALTCTALRCTSFSSKNAARAFLGASIGRLPFPGDTYLQLLEAAKAGAPDVHVHAFSPLEVTQGAATLGWTLRKYLAALKDAGLGSLPGTAAEVLDDEVRAIICPDKLSTSLWLEVQGSFCN